MVRRLTLDPAEAERSEAPSLPSALLESWVTYPGHVCPPACSTQGTAHAAEYLLITVVVGTVFRRSRWPDSCLVVSHSKQGTG